MERALYDSQDGYYGSGRAVIGRGGDFYTSVSVGAVFGNLLAEQIAEVHARLGSPRDFTIVEQGAGAGQLARDILSALRANHPALNEAARYVIVEPFAAQRETQRTQLADCADRVTWHETLETLGTICGVHLSNELVDAFPVHLVRRAGGRWRELFVRTADDGFQFIELNHVSTQLERFCESLPPDLPEGYTTELRPAAVKWVQTVAQTLDRGDILTIDYGLPRTAFYDLARSRGTLSCYHRHRRDEAPLEMPGLKDITAHVEFTSLAEAAQHAGLELAGYTDQHHFLVGLLRRKMERAGREDVLTPAERRAFATLMHPESMGAQFKVLGLTRNLAPAPPLAGFGLARDPRIALGL